MSDFRILTPYGCATVVNKELKERGLPALPAQMFYTYVKKGYIPSTLVDGKARVSELELAKWFEVYITKREAIAAAKATLASK